MKSLNIQFKRHRLQEMAEILILIGNVCKLFRNQSANDDDTVKLSASSHLIIEEQRPYWPTLRGQPRPLSPTTATSCGHVAPVT